MSTVREFEAITRRMLVTHTVAEVQAMVATLEDKPPVPPAMDVERGVEFPRHVHPRPPIEWLGP